MRIARELATECDETKCGEGTFVLAQIELIRGELLDDELVVGKIFIEGANYVVPVGVGEREHVVVTRVLAHGI